MTDHDDNLGDLLAQQMNDADEATPRQPYKPSPTKPSKNSSLKPLATVLAFLVGGGLMGFAIYGAMILRGMIEIEKENARQMAKIMLFASGPIGAILLIAALVMAAQMLLKK